MGVKEKTVLERAEALTEKVQAAANGSLGLMLGATGRGLLLDMAALVEDLAREVGRYDPATAGDDPRTVTKGGA